MRGNGYIPKNNTSATKGTNIHASRRDRSLVADIREGLLNPNNILLQSNYAYAAPVTIPVVAKIEAAVLF